MSMHANSWITKGSNILSLTNQNLIQNVCRWANSVVFFAVTYLHVYKFWSGYSKWARPVSKFRKSVSRSFQVHLIFTMWNGVCIRYIRVQCVKWTKGNYSKIRQGRIIVLSHCISTWWDISTYEISCLCLL
jgi:hypothetical protein